MPEWLPSIASGIMLPLKYEPPPHLSLHTNPTSDKVQLAKHLIAQKILIYSCSLPLGFSKMSFALL
jgi:hypothetical protein